MKVLKLENETSFKQLDLEDCNDGSLFQLIDGEVTDEGYVCRISENETNKVMGVRPSPRSYNIVEGLIKEEINQYQRWRIFSSGSNDKGINWFHFLNVGYNRPLDITASDQGFANVITFFNFHKGENQQFAIKVMKNLSNCS